MRFSQWVTWLSPLLFITELARAQITTPPPLFNPCAPVTPTTPTTTTTTPSWCSGDEEQYERCSFLPSCSGCVPEQCELGPWSEWKGRGACTFLCVRSRSVARVNNDCGTPCNGTLSESKRCFEEAGATCGENKNIDCQFGAWGQWIGCSGNALEQKWRRRSVNVYPLGGGLGCSGPVNETAPCALPVTHTDCQFSSWGPWLTCSRSCDGGHHTRSRTILSAALSGGLACNGSLMEEAACATVACPVNRECALGDWSSWTGCEQVAGGSQRTRFRNVSRPLEGEGRACQAVTKETHPCKSMSANCVITDWHEWNGCSATCGGGQRYRSRHLRNPGDSSNCFFNDMVETQACNSQMCANNSAALVVMPAPTINPCDPVMTTTLAPSADCKFGAWDDWSSCSTPCGIGVKKRTRMIASLADKGRMGCVGVVKEVAECWGNPASPECQRLDCVWDAWEEWSDCTISCGGGEKHRNRVVKVSPRNGGRLCDVNAKQMMATCNMHPCADRCIDGRWDEWSSWSECSVSCGDGVNSRSRRVAQMANDCGTPETGIDSEFSKCNYRPCESLQDCKFTDWNDWSFCSRHCYGTRHRFREISAFAKGGGKNCNGAVKMALSCNPDPGESPPSSCTTLYLKQDCRLSFWSDWTACSATCGVSQQQRSRHITILPANQGLTCNSSLSEARGCAEIKCPPPKCQNCQWGAWTTWSSCSACVGQKLRRRSIETQPNHCGHRCVAQSGEETMDCNGDCEPTHYCSWSEWTPYSWCPRDGCGPHTRTRQRTLSLFLQPPAHNHGTYYAKGPKSIYCFGMEAQKDPCNLPACVLDQPRPCIFAPWSEWEPPTCQGLCFRQRDIRQNSHLMPPCAGPIADTKICPKLCNEPVDCKLNDWKPWTMCAVAHHAQKYRSRRVIRYPKFGGSTCKGLHILNQTDFCKSLAVPKADCQLTAWASWTTCEKSCGYGGWQRRARHIQVPPTSGGRPCGGNMTELRGCNEMPCPEVHDPCAPASGPIGCTLNMWSDWSVCRPFTTQKYRHRSPTQTQICAAHLKEIAACPPQACIISSWGDWSVCPVTCGGGYHQRNRSVVLEASRGGQACPETLKEARACGDTACNPCAPAVQPCRVAQWTMWTSCSATCGFGFAVRSRGVISTRSPGGPACNMALLQNRTCNMSACPSSDCLWADWSVWSPCNRTCGRGQQIRTRSISNQPQPGGRPCDVLTTEEIQPCNLKDCHSVCVPVNGEWSPWSEWGLCTSNCRGGLTWRTRQVAQQMSPCGKPAQGLDKKIANCNAGVSCSGDENCIFGQWEPWNECSATCSGIAKRQRRIITMGRGRGRSCDGHLEQTASCNPGPLDDAPPPECLGPQRVDCVFGDWSDSGCPVTCGGASRNSSRHIRIRAEGGGAACNGPVVKETPCGQTDCPRGPTKAPCHWSDWGEWGACDRPDTHGQKKRFRRLVQPPAHPEDCPSGQSEETISCDGNHQKYCGWAAWGSWGECSKTCDLGTRKRKRSLTELDSPPEPELSEILFPGQPGYSTSLQPLTSTPPPTSSFTQPVFTTPPTTTTTILFNFDDYVQNHHTPADYGVTPGTYEIKKEVAVTKDLLSSSKMVSSLQLNMVVHVTEVQADLTHKRFRGRIQTPAGWISLFNMNDNHWWAHRVPNSLSAKYLEQPLHMFFKRFQDKELVASFLCGVFTLLSFVLLVRRYISDRQPREGQNEESEQLLR